VLIFNKYIIELPKKVFMIMKKLLLSILLTLTIICKSQTINLHLTKPTTFSNKDIYSCFIVTGVGIISNSLFCRDYNSYTNGMAYSFRPRYGFISIGIGFVTIGITGLKKIKEKD
jgi:hypothetical protein